MLSKTSSALAGALSAAMCLFAHSQAEAHAVCGNRIFPATLGIDDPGVNDELALPTVTYIPPNTGGTQEFDASFSYTKTIFPNFGLSITDGKTWLNPGGNGWGNIDTELKYMFWCDAPHEFMASVGLDVTWANTGTKNFSDPFNTFTPLIDMGKGFGDLPTSLNILRPFAITAELGLSIPSAPHTSSIVYDDSGNPSLNVALNPTVFDWGFTLQYSLPYMNANVSEVGGPDFLRHLVPITEFAFQTPVSNYAPGGNVTTGTIQPGAIYMADTWQVAVEALIPINGASGHNVGAVAELHFFFDDIFPNSLGKPLFQ
ncbi:hypothetical protein [Methylocapsa sp. S129]|uniref:hypothetical protein n=1 Tax=Methylocapsa sp. S129 TaxID=1641869 RepID=UPI00131CC068|nr:hypothetical protein [Methylocapsa sp. S129]